MKWRTISTLLLLVFAGGLIAHGQTPAPREDTALEAQLRAAIAPFQGKVALYTQNLQSGSFAAIDADVPVPTASVIKLAILEEALEQMRAGKVKLDDRLTLTKADQVPGSGILLFFDTPQTLTLHDALTLMIVMSDNVATNLVIDRLGIANIDARIQALGLKNSWLYKKIMQPATSPMPADQPQFGLGKTTAREMASLLQRFVTCRLDPPGPSPQALCDIAMQMLERQFYRDGLPRYLDGTGLRIANKTGALDHVRNDVGVVYTKCGPVLISIFTRDNADTSWTSDNLAELLIAKLSRDIINYWH